MLSSGSGSIVSLPNSIAGLSIGLSLGSASSKVVYELVSSRTTDDMFYGSTPSKTYMSLIDLYNESMSVSDTFFVLSNFDAFNVGASEESAVW